jgi:spore coat protein U-like protein
LAFGLYDPSSSSPTDGVGTVDLSCTNLMAATPSGASVALSLSTTSDRKMLGNGHALNYGIYTNAARSVNWGDGSAAPMVSTGAMQANERKSMHFTLYGRIPPLQNIAAGNYADSLLITITP